MSKWRVSDGTIGRTLDVSHRDHPASLSSSEIKFMTPYRRLVELFFVKLLLKNKIVLVKNVCLTRPVSQNLVETLLRLSLANRVIEDIRSGWLNPFRRHAPRYSLISHVHKGRIDETASYAVRKLVRLGVPRVVVTGREFR